MESRSTERGPVVIRVAIEKIDPLTGHAITQQGHELGFHGWLGLLNAFSALLDPSAQAAERGEGSDSNPEASDQPQP